MAIRGIRQGIPGGYILGRKAGARGAVGIIPLGNGANGTATAGGFVPQATQTAGFTMFNSAGVWSSTSAYNPGDVVTYNGGAYVNYVAILAPGPNPSPDQDDAHWFSQGAVNTVDSNFAISTGQLQLATIASGDVLGNSTSGTAEPTAATLTAMIDRAFGSTEGQILQRGASAWQILAPGSAGQVLLSGGAAALNSWGTDQLGVATNSNAPAGDKGEFVSAAANNVGQSNNNVTNLTTISLSAGDWEVWGSIQYSCTATAITDVYCCVSTTTLDVTQSNMLTAPFARAQTITAVAGHSVTPPPLRVSVSGTTTVYLVAFTLFGSGTCNAYGAISARRIR